MVLTVKGANGQGMGFGFISAGTTAPTSRVVYEGGLLRAPGYWPDRIDDEIDGIWQSDIALFSNTFGLNVDYVCGLAGDYAKFAPTAFQPHGCADTTGFYLDDTYMAVASTKYNSATNILAVTFKEDIPSTVHIGDMEIIALAVNAPINSTTFWKVLKMSASTMLLYQPGFKAESWDWTDDPTAIVSKDFYSNPHPNSTGYQLMDVAYYHDYAETH